MDNRTTLTYVHDSYSTDCSQIAHTQLCTVSEGVHVAEWASIQSHKLTDS